MPAAEQGVRPGGAWFGRLAVIAVLLVACSGSRSQAQIAVTPPAGSSVALDEIDNASQSALLRAEALLGEAQWDEAVENIRRVMETSGDRLVAASTAGGFVRWLPAREYCQILLASFHERAPEALRIYRRQVDPLARQWYEDGLARRDAQMLARVVDELFLSSYGDDASYWLGELAWERGSHTAARAAWERISPEFRYRPPAEETAARFSGYPLWLLLRDVDLQANWAQIESALAGGGAPAGWLAYPDSDLDLAAVRARLVLVSLLEGNTRRADVELGLLARLAPDARGTIAGREGKLVELLESLRQESLAWSQPPSGSSDWPTFAGASSRLRRAARSVDVGGRPIWQVALPRQSAIPPEGGPADLLVAEDAEGLLSHHPLVVGDTVLLRQGPGEGRLAGVDLHTGGPRLGPVASPVDEAPAQSGSEVPRRFTTTVHRDMLLAVVDQPRAPASRLVGLDLRADLKLVLDMRLSGTEWDGAWSFDGAPLAEGGQLYVALRKDNRVRAEAHVACFDAHTGRLGWRRFVAAADARSAPWATAPQNLLSLAEQTLYFNTNLGLVAALGVEDGAVRWAVEYPRVDSQPPDAVRNELHFFRDLNPCLVHRDLVLVAPRDCEHLFCLDAVTGMLLWATPPGQAADAIHLLGVGQDRLIVSGECLYWFDVASGQLVGRFPSGFHAAPGHARPSPRGFGRGLLAGDVVLWPTREAIYLLEQRTSRSESGWQPVLAGKIELAARGARGGNLVVADGVLLVAAEDRLFAFNESGTVAHDASRRSPGGREAQ